jgi:hypothetical protein
MCSTAMSTIATVTDVYRGPLQDAAPVEPEPLTE